MFLNFDKSEPQRSYKHGSYQKKKCTKPAEREFSLVLKFLTSEVIHISKADNFVRHANKVP